MSPVGCRLMKNKRASFLYLSSKNAHLLIVQRAPAHYNQFRCNRIRLVRIVLNRLRIWAIDEESVVPKSKICHNEEITCFSTTTSGTLLATGSADLSLKLWQIDTGFLIQVRPITFVVFSYAIM